MKVLVLTPFYKFFVKGLTDSLARLDEISEINVLVHHNPLSELAPIIPHSYSKWLEKFRKKNLVNVRDAPQNVKVHVISTLYFVPDGRNLGIGDKLFKLFDKHIRKKGLEFDLIHAHFTWPQGYAAVKLGKKYNVPVVITLHENREWLLKLYSSGNTKIYWAWKNASALIRINKKDITLIQKFNNHVYSIPNGFDPTKLRIVPQEVSRRKLGLPENLKVLLSLGNLIERKGFQYLISAMSKVAEYRKDVLCFIGGDGPLRNRLQTQINELGLQDKVKLLGFVPDGQLPYWMNATDLFVLPSLSEGNPTVMFEALGVGLPFVGTKVGGVPEIISSEDYGLLCEPGNVDDLAEKILIALNREWDRRKILEYAKQFTWENIAKEVLGVYHDVIG